MTPARSITTTSPGITTRRRNRRTAPVFNIGTAATSTTLPPNPVPPNTVVQLYRTHTRPNDRPGDRARAVLVNMVTTTAGGVVRDR